MNSLVALGTGTAYLYSVIATVAPANLWRHGVAPNVSYEAVLLIIAMVLCGNTLEARAKGQAGSALRKLIALQPATARVLRTHQDTAQADLEVEIPLAQLRAGDHVVVRPGERLPLMALSCLAIRAWMKRCSRASRCRSKNLLIRLCPAAR